MIPDGSLGTTVFPIAPIYFIQGGQLRGANLFHSFESFDVSAGEGAVFLLPAGDLANIFARITGGTASSIGGGVGVAQFTGTDLVTPGTNLFLINPHGIIFNESAELNVGGAFVATTADTLEFGSAGQFSALNQEVPSPLLTVNPSAFLFTQAIPGPIVNRSTVLTQPDPLRDPVPGLLVPEGQSLILLADQVLIDGSGLNAFGGRIELGAVAGTGRVGLAQTGGGLSLSFPAEVAPGDIALINGSRLNTVGPDGGDVVLHGHNIDLAGGSDILVGIAPLAGDRNSRAGDIQVSASGRLRLAEASTLSNNVYLSLGSTGNIAIAAQTLELLNGSSISAFAVGQGNSGNITVKVGDTIFLGGTGPGDEISQILSTTLILEPVDENAPQVGSITLQAPRVILSDGAQLVASSFSPTVNAGSIQIQASDQLSVSGEGTLIQSITNSSGRAGDINIQAGAVQVRDEAIITALTNSTGRAGDVNVQAGSVQVGNDAIITTLSNGTGDAGNITLEASGTLGFSRGGRVLAATANQGNAGNITLRAGGDVVIDGVGRDEDFSGVSSSADEGSQGRGGDILIAAGQSLLVTRGGIINAATGGTGPGGNITLRLGSLLLVDDSNITTLATQSTGGDITITADQIRLLTNGDISTVVLSGEGGGGNIFMTARSIIALGDSDILAFSIGGSGGNITLNTPAFFGENFRPAPPGTNPILLDDNGRVDVNASGAIASGAIALPDVSFIQNSLSELPDTVVNPDQLIAGSCIAPRAAGTASLVITGSDSLPAHPGEAPAAPFATGSVQAPTPTGSAPWQPGDAIIEPNAVSALADGRLVLARNCTEAP